MRALNLPGVACLSGALLAIGCGSQIRTSRVNLPAEMQAIATFDDARALSVDAIGRIYVSDAAANQVVVLDKKGQRLLNFGGPGLADGQFDEPTDIDATNGLSILVADFGNGRVQRFSRTGVFLESIPVVSQTSSDTRPVFARGREDVSREGRGQPIGVTAAGSEDIYVLDGASSTVVALDRNRQLLWRMRPETSASPDRVPRPVSIEGRRDSIFVVDRVAARVTILDMGGSRLAISDAGPAASRVAQTPSEIVVVHDSGLRCTSGHLSFEMPQDLGQIVDAAFDGRSWFLLTSRSLFAHNRLGLCRGGGWVTDIDALEPRSSLPVDARQDRGVSSGQPRRGHSTRTDP